MDSDEQLHRILASTAGRDDLFADLFRERRASASAVYEAGHVDDLVTTRESGMSVRRITPGGIVFDCREGLSGDPGDDPSVGGLPDFEACEKAIRKRLDAVTEVRIAWHDNGQCIAVCNSEGCLSRDRRRWQRIKLTVMRGDARLTARTRSRGTLDSPPLLDAACRRLEHHLRARTDGRPIVPGAVDVILPPGFGAVFFHETCGHMLEADSASAFRGLVGESVASPLLTIVDDAAHPGLPGTLTVDDEGFPATRRTLIEAGRLVGLLHDRHTALREGLDRAACGNARRESFRCVPLPRMTNLLVAPGPHGGMMDIVGETERGFLVGEIEIGRVDMAAGTFSFCAVHGHAVTGGHVDHPTGPVLVEGRITDALGRIDRVGGDFEWDDGSSFCSKSGQTVPVGLGQPTVRLRGLDLRPL